MFSFSFFNFGTSGNNKIVSTWLMINFCTHSDDLTTWLMINFCTYSDDVKFVGYNLKVSHGRHVCNCYYVMMFVESS